MDYRFKII